MAVIKEDWKASTLGVFICYLIDNLDPVVIWRITGETDVGDGIFTQDIELVLVPDGSVVETLEALKGGSSIEKTLVALIDAGLIE